MSEETRVTNEKTGGQKNSKPEQFSLLPWKALGYIARVFYHGSQKYSPNNWRKGYSWSLSYDAVQRHLALFWDGEDNDPEFGLPHLAHAGFHILVMLTFLLDPRYKDLDDRPIRFLEENDAAERAKANEQDLAPEQCIQTADNQPEEGNREVFD